MTQLKKPRMTESVQPQGFKMSQILHSVLIGK